MEDRSSMRARTAAYIGIALAGVTGLAANCSRAPTTDPTVPIPSVITPTAEPPTPVQNADDCQQVCDIAQDQCKTHKPSTVEHCVGKCRASTNLTKPALSCLAIMFTCDEEC